MVADFVFCIRQCYVKNYSFILVYLKYSMYFCGVYKQIKNNNMRTKILKFIAVLSMVLLAFNGCKKDEGEEPAPTPEPPIEETSVRHYTENTEKQKVEMFPDVVYVRNDINELLQENNIDNKTISFTNGEALKKWTSK